MSQTSQCSTSYASSNAALHERSPNLDSKPQPSDKTFGKLVESSVSTKARQQWDSVETPVKYKSAPVTLSTALADWLRPERHESPDRAPREMNYLREMTLESSKAQTNDARPKPVQSKPKPMQSQAKPAASKAESSRSTPSTKAKEQAGRHAVADIRKQSAKPRIKPVIKTKEAPKSSKTADPLSTQPTPSKRALFSEIDIASSSPKRRKSSNEKGNAKADVLTVDLDEEEEEMPCFDIFHGLDDAARDIDQIEGLKPLTESSSQSMYDPSVPLCPFCDAPLPKKPSARLLRLIAKGRKRAEGTRPEADNPDALFLSAVDSANICAIHRDEAETIPEGLSQGYPAEIDFGRLKRRLRREARDHLRAVIEGEIKSRFLIRARKEWETRGAIAMSGLMAQMHSFEEELPGYYGPLGTIAILDYVKATLVDTRALTATNTQPLGVDNYVRRVMVPEAAVCLIMRDLDIDRSAAIKVLKTSRAYGMAKFPLLD